MSTYGRVMSEETKQKIRRKALGRISPMKGKKMSAESKSKMRTAKLGRKLPDSTRLKMSIASKGSRGFHHSDETKEKLRQAKLGKSLSVEHRAKIGAGGKGRIFSEEHKRKIALSRTGEKNPSWKGGITPATAKERQRFSEKVTPLVFARDNYTCQICDQYGGKLHADHIKSWSEYPDLRFDIGNCRTLCRACHYFVTFKKTMPQGSKWGFRTVIRWENK